MGKCIITYKGQKYSEEQFKEYFINNKQEFATSIAKNKDVIDSFKRKMEGIGYVFSQSPELASIGSKAQYLQYLSTIFPNSKVKDIVYHNTDTLFEKFQSIPVAKFFTKSTLGGKKYRLPIVLNITNPKVFSEFTEDDEMTYGLAEMYNKNKEKDGIINGTEGETRTEYVVFEPEQIHVMGGKNDIQGFKDFMSFENSEFSKYGTYQQFRDFVTSKSSIEIENRLIETGKIDRVC